jgi:hypothetical protein
MVKPSARYQRVWHRPVVDREWTTDRFLIAFGCSFLGFVLGACFGASVGFMGSFTW